jgi:multidrug resistance efflux pump
MVLKLNIIEGKHVDRGFVLAELESVDYKAEMDRAKATLDGAKQRLLELEHGSRKEEIEEAGAELAEAKEQLIQLRSTWERTKRLHDLGTKVVTENEFEIAQSTFLAMVRRVERLTSALSLMKIGPRQEKIDAARADVALAQADYDKSKWRFENCIVRAPLSGTILQKNAEEGNIVNPIVFQGSYSICKMANLADLEVDLNIQERDISNVFAGQRCKIHTDAYPDRIYDGSVSRLMPIADRAKGAIPVRVKLEIPAAEEGVYLKPEMGAIVSFYKK